MCSLLAAVESSAEPFFQMWERLSSEDAGRSSAPGGVDPENPAPIPVQSGSSSPSGSLGALDMNAFSTRTQYCSCRTQTLLAPGSFVPI